MNVTDLLYKVRREFVLERRACGPAGRLAQRATDRVRQAEFDCTLEEYSERYIRPAAESMREDMIQRTMTSTGCSRAEAEVFVRESVGRIQIIEYISEFAQ